MEVDRERNNRVQVIMKGEMGKSEKINKIWDALGRSTQKEKEGGRTNNTKGCLKESYYYIFILNCTHTKYILIYINDAMALGQTTSPPAKVMEELMRKTVLGLRNALSDYMFTNPFSRTLQFADQASRHGIFCADEPS